MADKTIKECVNEEWDLIVLPGGMPGGNLSTSSKFNMLLLICLFDHFRFLLTWFFVCFLFCFAFTHFCLLAEHLRDSAELVELLRKQKAAYKYDAAICGGRGIIIIIFKKIN